MRSRLRSKLAGYEMIEEVRGMGLLSGIAFRLCGNNFTVLKADAVRQVVGELPVFAHSRHSLRPLVTASSSHG